MLIRTILVAATVAVVASSAMAADKVTGDYLVGKWSLEGKPACDVPDFEHIVFDRDGAFRSYRRGRLEAAGLWHIGDDYVEFHVVSSAARINPELKEYVGYFAMASIEGLETKVEKNHLELAVKSNGKLDHWRLDRCAR